MMHSRYGKDSLSARQAQEMAHIIAFGPVIFQVSRVRLDYGIFDYLRSRTDDGATVGEVAQAVCITDYAAKVLLESSLTLGTVLCNDGRYSLSKVGWFFLTDPMVKVNMDFNYDINYKGMFHLEEALVEGRPAGLAELGPWKTIYEGLSLLSPQQQSSWFGFDHFYSDSAFDDALPKVFASAPSRILDIGGNTGKWAMKCVGYSKDVMVTVADLPGQVVRGAGGVDACAVDLHSMAVDHADAGAQLFQNAQTQCDVGNLGDVFNTACPVHQQRGGKDGDGGVFGTADLHLAKQGMTTLYDILCQIKTLSSKGAFSFAAANRLCRQFARLAALHTRERCQVR